MSIIMTAGKNKVDWSPKEEKTLTKTASTEEVVEASDDDALFEAAKSVLEVEEAPEVSEVAEETEEIAESVEEAVEKVEEAVEDLKEVVEGEEGEEGEDEVAEVEIDVVDEDEVAEVEIDVVDEEPVAEEGEIFVESEPACCESCGSALGSKEEKDDTFASSGEEFVRYAKISPANRKKLKQYWKGMLNYVPDYVDLMTKDYE